MKFSAYNLKENLLKAIQELGYYDLTPIQEAAIPKILKGKSLICKSSTGSGKTHAFLVPIINSLTEENKVQAIIISPTSELARQTYNFAKKICDKLEIPTKLVSGEGNKAMELEAFKYGQALPKLVIGTPGKIFDIFLKERSDYSKVKTIVLDEADMLIDNSYKDQVFEIIASIRPSQRLVFTATMKEHLIQDTYKFIGAEEIIDIDRYQKVNKNVKHHLVDIKHKNIIDQLINFIDVTNPYFTLVFASEKTQVEKIYKELNNRSIQCGIINGNMESRERKIMMKRIKNGDFTLVICSDIASRGIDLENVSTVISIDLPKDLDYYYHRAGRTGRYNKQGDSYIFYDVENFSSINKLIKNKIEFDYYVLREGSLKKVENSLNKTKKKNELLEKEIHKEVAKVKTKKVKPGYKKKVREAVKKAKENHKKQIIRKNIKEKKRLIEENKGY